MPDKWPKLMVVDGDPSMRVPLVATIEGEAYDVEMLQGARWGSMH